MRHFVHKMQYVDYFPSYEIISSFPYKASFYEPDLRSVSPIGVKHVMKIFFESTNMSNQTLSLQRKLDKDNVCEEVLLMHLEVANECSGYW